MRFWKHYWRRYWDPVGLQPQPPQNSPELALGQERLPPTLARRVLTQTADRDLNLRHQAAHSLQGSMGNRNLAPSDPGQPLSPRLRERLEASLNTDLSKVRLHQDAATTKALQARALTTGPHILLRHAADAHNPALLGHEVAHQVQAERRGTHSGLSTPTDASEREAEPAAQAVLAGHAAPISTDGPPVPALQRQESSLTPVPTDPMMRREAARTALFLHYQQQGAAGPLGLTPRLSQELQRLIPAVDGDDLALLWTPEPRGPMAALQRLIDAGLLPLIGAEPKGEEERR